MRAIKFVPYVLVGILSAAPAAFAQQHQTPDEAKALSDKAASHFKEVGVEQALADFSNPTAGYQNGDLFVVVYDHDGKIIATGVPALLGRNATALKDADGVEFGKAILNAPNGSWVTYRMTNPAIKKIEKKTSYVNKVDDYTVFVGAYVP